MTKEQISTLQHMIARLVSASENLGRCEAEDYWHAAFEQQDAQAEVDNYLRELENE